MKKRNRSLIAALLAGLVLGTACATSAPTPNVAATSAAQAATPTALSTATASPTPLPPTPTATPTPLPATATVSTRAQVAVPTATPAIATCPFYVYAGWDAAVNHYVPERWLGDTGDIKYNPNYVLDQQRPSVIQIIYTPAGRYRLAGIYWWDPAGYASGQKDGGFNLSCAKKLTFWARGEKGGEVAEFKVGGLQGTYHDSLQPALTTGSIKLTAEWVQYTLDLSGHDLSHIIGGLVWVTNADLNPQGATIYLAEIRYE